MCELVNQYPQDDDAIPFYSIGFTLGILSLIVWKQIWELSKVNCKKRIVLPWANAVRQKEIPLELQQTVLKSNCY
jgi:hypothetical protein